MNNLQKYHCLFFLLLFVGLESYSQSKEIDSLRQLIKTEKYDTTRIRLYNDLGIIYWYINTDKSIEAAKKAVVLAYKIKYYKQLARSYNVIGGAYKINNDIVAAYKNSKKSFKIANQFGFEKDLVNSITNIAGLYGMGAEIENKEIEQYCNKLILLTKNEYLNKIIYSFLAIYDRRNFSANYFDIIKYIEGVNIDKANELYPIFCLLKAHDFESRNKYFDALYYINLCQEDNINPLMEVVANNTKAKILYTLQRYNEAEVVCELLIKKYKKANEKAIQSVLFITNDILIAAYTKNHKYKNGYDLIIDQLKTTNMPMCGATLEFNANSAHIYYGLDSIQKAIKIIDNVLTVSKNVENYNAYADMLCLKISILRKQGKYIETFKCINDLERIPFDKLQIRSQFDVFSVLSKYFKTLKHFDKTSLYLEKLLTVQDSINKRDVISIIEEEKVKYEVDKKQQQIITQKKDIKNKNIQIRFSLAIIVLLLTLIFIIIKYQFKNREIEIKKQQSLENELQLTTLRSKVIPHFTKNVLSAIGQFAMTDKLKAGHYIAVFSKFTQLTLSNADKNYVSLQDEVSYLETYLELEKMRFGNRFNYTIRIDENVNKKTLIPTMTLHTYCDNAIRHGLVHKVGPGELMVTVCRLNDGVLIVVKDNGVGRLKAAELGTQGNGQGLKLVQSQIDFYNQRNVRHIVQRILDLTDGNGNHAGTQVELFVPDNYLFN